MPETKKELLEKTEELEEEKEKIESQKEKLEDEVIRLRARVQELEELSRKGRQRRTQAEARAESRETSEEEYDDRNRGTEREARMNREDDEPRNIVSNTSFRAIDETSRFLRGITLSYVEGVRSVADVVQSFADEVFQRNEPERSRSERPRSERERSDRGRSDRDRSETRSGNILSGYARAVDRSVDIPRKAFDRFSETYNERDQT